MNDKLLPVVRVDRKIRWHYTTTILRLRIGARLTRYRIVIFTISLALSAGTLMASAGTPYRHIVPAHFYPWLLQSFQRVVPSDATLLGAPLFRGPVLDQAWADRCDDLSIAIIRLRQIGSHDARAKFCTCFVAHLQSYTRRWPALIHF